MCHKKIWFQGRDRSDLSRDSAVALKKSLSLREWDLFEQVQDCKKTLRVALPHCMDKTSENSERGFPLPLPIVGRTGAVRTGHRLVSQAPESEVSRQAHTSPVPWPAQVCQASSPACSGSGCSCRWGGSRGSRRCSRPGGWSAWSRAAGSCPASCACCSAGSRPVYWWISAEVHTDRHTHDASGWVILGAGWVSFAVVNKLMGPGVESLAVFTLRESD